LISSLSLVPVAEAGAVVLNMDSDYASKGCTPSNRGLAGRACPALFAGVAREYGHSSISLPRSQLYAVSWKSSAAA
ncbi:MAG TPA: hypothetical protein VK198_15625, partial [Terriglobales bacterium]|nr:hypothetical protein [Terriglobales bacterium]